MRYYTIGITAMNHKFYIINVSYFFKKNATPL